MSITMSSRSSAPDTSENPEQKPARQSGLGLSKAQVTGSALASVSAAVAASWLGVAGTIIGAALGSLFGTVGSALYAQTLRRSGQAVKRIRPTTVSGARAQSRAGAGAPADRADPNQAVDQEPLTDSVEKTSLIDRLRLLQWRRIAVATGVVLVIALAAITAFETLTGTPVSNLTGGKDQKGTTIGRVLDRSSNSTSDDTSKDQSDDQSQDPTSEPDQTDEAEPESTTDATTEPTASDSTTPDTATEEVPSETAEATPSSSG